MKHIVLGLFFILMTTSVAHAATGSGGRIGIAAIVNDDVVTFSDVSNRIKLYAAGAPQAPTGDAMKKAEQQTLSRLIDEKLQLQEAKDLGVAVGDDQVNTGLAEIARQNGMSADDFKAKLQAQGIKISSLLDQIRAEIAWSQVIKRKLRPQVNVSESEIDSEMDQLVRTSGKTEYRVAEIFLNVADPKDDADVKNNADKIVADITKGASFAQIAKQYSQSPGASTGGDIGWIQQGQLGGSLDEALLKMQPGQISPPLRSDKGYHIIFLRDVRQNDVIGDAAPTTPEAAAPAPAADVVTDATLHLKQIVIPLGKVDPQPIINAKIVRAQTLKTEVTSCDMMAQKAKDFMSEGTGDLGSVSLSKLTEPVKSAVANLAVNTLSAPVRLPDGIAVLMVCDRQDITAPAPAAAAADIPLPKISGVAKTTEASRDKIANKIGQQRLTQLQERYLRDLRATAFIDKRI